jgi:hypothetical protein
VNCPTNTRSGFLNPITKCIDFTAGNYSESENGSLTIEGYHKLWSKHVPYDLDDWRNLGDNWNYFIRNQSDIETFGVPECDPIRTHPPNIPCFPYCVAPPGIECEDLDCFEGSISCLSTNLQGKFGVYFDTMSHGGDNFKFRVTSVYSMPGVEDCLKLQNLVLLSLSGGKFILTMPGWKIVMGNFQIVLGDQNQNG